MLYVDLRGCQRSLKNLPELLGLRLLGEVSALEVQCFPVPFHPQSYPWWLSHRHARTQLPHLHPGPLAAQSGETQVTGAWEPHGHTYYDRI